MLQKLLEYYEVEAAPPTPAGPRHTFTIIAGGSGSVGYNRPGGFGSIVAGSSADYTLPNGRTTTIQHCRFVGSNLNFAIIPGDIPVAQFPGTIILLNTTANRMITVKRPSSVRNIQGGTITRGDYTVAPSDEQETRDGYTVQATLPLVLVTTQTIQVELYD